MFLICGEALFDVFPGAETPGGLALDARMGGSPFNVAIGLARLGCSVGLFTGLSEDFLGERLRRALSREGVDGRFLVRKPNPTTLALVNLMKGGEPSYTFHGHDAADRVLTPDDLPQLPEEVCGLHFGSYSLIAGRTADTLLALARREGGRRLISLDPNLRLGVEPDIALWRRRIASFCEVADVIKASQEDLAALFPGAAFEDLAARWHVQGASLVIVTRGDQGARVSLRGEVFDAPAGKVAVVDTVGAGDAFQAALLCGLQELGRSHKSSLAGITPDDCRRLAGFACAAAAQACSRRGADLAHRRELPDL